MTLLLGEEVRFKGFDLPAPRRASLSWRVTGQGPGERTTYTPGEVMRLILYWEAASEMETSYVVLPIFWGRVITPKGAISSGDR
jgi:hypothetical protein